MKSPVAKCLLPSAFLLLLPLQASASKVVGTCEVNVVGPHPFTITGKLYEGKAPENVPESTASTNAWAHKAAEEYRPLSATLAEQKTKMADMLLYALHISCVSEKGMLLMQPYDGTAKTADYPARPRVFRLVGDNMRDRKSGDVAAALMSKEFQTGMIQPAEAGELKVTLSDGDRFVATFSFKSKTSTVTGTVNFTRPKEITK